MVGTDSPAKPSLNTSNPIEVTREYFDEHGEYPNVYIPPKRSRRPVIGAGIIGVLVLATLLAIGAEKRSPQIKRHDTGSAQKTTTTPPELVTVIQSPAQNAVTFNIHLTSFSVKVVAFGGATGFTVTDSGRVKSVHSHVMAAGENQTLPIRHTVTITTGSPPVRAYLYDGTKFIGFYFPNSGPFTMTFHALGKRIQ